MTQFTKIFFFFY